MDISYGQLDSDICKLHINEDYMYRSYMINDDIAKRYGYRYSIDLSRLSVMVYPYHPFDILNICDRWHMWLWLYDDKIDNNDRDDSLILLMQDIMYDIKRILTDNNYNHFKMMVDDYLSSLNMVGKYKDDYIPWRLRNSACETVFSLIVPNIDIDFNAKQHQRYVANYVCSITNDIFSYDKEVKDGKEMDNYIYYITTPSTSIVEIKRKLLDEVLNMINNFEVKDIYDKRLKIWMQQNYIWHKTCKRY